MKVSSPVGDLPFKPTRIRVKNGSIHLDGAMGAWPAHVQIEISDIFDLAYLLRYVLIVLLASIGGIMAILFFKGR